MTKPLSKEKSGKHWRVYNLEANRVHPRLMAINDQTKELLRGKKPPYELPLSKEEERRLKEGVAPHEEERHTRKSRLTDRK